MTRPTSIVTGASGQDGYLLAQQLLDRGGEVHAVVRRPAAVADLPRTRDEAKRLTVHVMDIVDAAALAALVDRVQPDEIYNLAGQSSVSASFADPDTTWRTNVEPVLAFLEAIRTRSPASRLYQSSSSEMFGSIPGGEVVHDERSPLAPQSPYAAAKAAAHVACAAYRTSYGLRVACGILFNHESRRRSGAFLSRKVVDYVGAMRAARGRDAGPRSPLRMGNLSVRRDWGYAPDYVDGIILVARQIEVRASVLGCTAEPDTGASYRDYVLGTGTLTAVWELVDRAFHHGGFALRWSRESNNPAEWRAWFEDTGELAVVVDSTYLRPADPAAIQADPSLARRELGWSPQVGLEAFLAEMLDRSAAS